MIEFIQQLFTGTDTAHRTALDLAIIFAAALLVGRLVKVIKFLPKVTIYLLVGLALGPSAAKVIDYQDVQSMEVLRTIALSLILFLVGTEFRLEGLSSKLKQSLKISAWSGGLTFFLTFTFCLIAALFSEDLREHAFTISILLGIFALEVGPASTLAVLREHNSHGPYTDHLRLLVGNDNLIVLICFTFASIFLLNGADVSFTESLGSSLSWLLLPLPIGIVLGSLLAWVETFEEKASYRLIAVLALLMASLGISRSLDISAVFTSMVAGFAYANSSVRGLPVVATMRILETPFYIVFFIYTGANLHLEDLGTMIETAPVLGIAYLVFRTAGKYYGTKFGARRVQYAGNEPHLLASSVLSHSAIVLALLVIVKNRLGEGGIYPFLEMLILGSVVIFEVFGPILVKMSVLRSGEVSIINAIPHKSKVVDGNQLLAIIKNFLAHLGISRKTYQNDLSALVIQDTRALSAASDYNKVIKFIESYPYDSFPVINGEGLYTGYISFNELKDASYDPIMKDLIRAADLQTTGVAIDLDDDDVESAYERIRALTYTSLPVIRHDKEGNQRLIGVILQRDLTSAHLRLVGKTMSDYENASSKRRDTMFMFQESVAKKKKPESLKKPENPK